MIKRVLTVIILGLFAYMLFLLISGWEPRNTLNPLAREYVSREPDELGAANLVTAIVVTYRGLDTLGEVTVLFLAAAGVGLFLRVSEKRGRRRDSSEILKTGTSFIIPAIIMFGTYIFLNGHLTPGGGFQGGAVIASGILFLFLSFPDYRLRYGALHIIESLSGAFYVVVGVLGVFLAGGFLDNRFLPLGEFGQILSAGAIPVIYTFIGLKVGTELTGIISNLKGS